MSIEAITEADVRKFFDVNQAFTWRFLQDVYTFLRVLNERGYTLSFALQCIRYRKEMERRRIQIIRSVEELWAKNGLKCRDCGKAMSVEGVNTGPGDQVPGGWKSIWRCVDYVDCGYEELSRKSVAAWLDKLHLRFTTVHSPSGLKIPKEALPEEIVSIKGPEYPTPEE